MPLQAMNALSKLPIVGSKSMNKNLEKMLKVYLTFYTASKRIEWIETGNWKFINQKVIDIIPMLSKEERFYSIAILEISTGSNTSETIASVSRFTFRGRICLKRSMGLLSF